MATIPGDCVLKNVLPFHLDSNVTLWTEDGEFSSGSEKSRQSLLVLFFSFLVISWEEITNTLQMWI